MTELTFAIGLLLLGIIIWLFARHAGPTLNAGAPQSRVPAGLSHAELIDWLKAQEAALPIVPGAESRILLAGPLEDGNGLDAKEQNNKTPVSILHIHGFSAENPWIWRIETGVLLFCSFASNPLPSSKGPARRIRDSAPGTMGRAASWALSQSMSSAWLSPAGTRD